MNFEKILRKFDVKLNCQNLGKIPRLLKKYIDLIKKFFNLFLKSLGGY